MHPQGHVVPVLTTSMALMTTEHVKATMRRAKVGGSINRQMRLRGHEQHTSNQALREPHLEGPSSPEDATSDSFTLMRSGKAADMSPQMIASAHIRFFGSLLVFMAHFMGDNPKVRKTLSLVGVDDGLDPRMVHALSLVGLPLFFVLLGHSHRQHLTLTRFLQTLFPLAAMLWLTVYSGLPEAFVATTTHSQPWFGAQNHVIKLTNPFWFLHFVIAYLTVAFAFTVLLHMLSIACVLPPRLQHRSKRSASAVCALLAIAAVIWFDGALPGGSVCSTNSYGYTHKHPYPKDLCPSGYQLPKHYALTNYAPLSWIFQPHGNRTKPELRAEASFEHKTLGSFWLRYGDMGIQYWWFYAAVPLLLPADFPARLPFEGRTAGRRSNLIRLVWAGAWILIAIYYEELFDQHDMGVVKVCSYLACRYVAVVGSCAVVPRSRNVLTELCSFSVAIYALHEYILMVIEVPVATGIATICENFDFYEPRILIWAFTLGASLLITAVTCAVISTLVPPCTYAVSCVDALSTQTRSSLQTYLATRRDRVARNEHVPLLPLVKLRVD